MNEIKINSSLLIKLQNVSWYFLLGYFLLAVIAHLFNFTVPFNSGLIGVLLVLFLTLLKLILIAEQFRKIRLVRLTFIAYLLLLMILITILVRSFL